MLGDVRKRCSIYCGAKDAKLNGHEIHPFTWLENAFGIHALVFKASMPTSHSCVRQQRNSNNALWRIYALSAMIDVCTDQLEVPSCKLFPSHLSPFPDPSVPSLSPSDCLAPPSPPLHPPAFLHPPITRREKLVLFLPFLQASPYITRILLYPISLPPLPYYLPSLRRNNPPPGAPPSFPPSIAISLPLPFPFVCACGVLWIIRMIGGNFS